MTDERGNVLWLILIAVVMLAAISMTLSRSGSNVEQSGDRERVAIEALYIMRTAKAMETAVQNLTFQGISINEVSFENAVSTTEYENEKCEDNSCRIFKSEGAGLTYTRPKAGWLDKAFSGEKYYGEWMFTGGICIPKVGDGDDTTCNNSPRKLEMMVVLPFIGLGLCQEINRHAKMRITAENPPEDSGKAWDNAPQFVGSFSDAAEVLADSNQDLYGQVTGCFEGSSEPPTGSYHFYHVLMAR